MASTAPLPIRLMPDGTRASLLIPRLAWLSNKKDRDFHAVMVEGLDNKGLASVPLPVEHAVVGRRRERHQ
eukprot:1188847-Prorocentrum_minimum.AAC.1